MFEKLKLINTQIFISNRAKTAIALCICVLLAMGSKISAQQNVYSFEEANIPSEWNQVTNGSLLSISDKQFKVGNQSLQWNWQKGGTLTVTNPNDLVSKCKNAGSGLYAWVYNEQPIVDTLSVDLLNKEQAIVGNFKMYLNFKGWRCISIAFKDDAKYVYSAQSPLTFIRFNAPTITSSGRLFFDMVSVNTSTPWNRTTDYFVKTAAKVRDFLTPSKMQPKLEGISLADTTVANHISSKLEEWMLGTANLSVDDALFSNRLKSTNQWISWSKPGSTANAANDFSRIELTRGEDGTVSGKLNGQGVGIFSIGAGNYLDMSKLNEGAFFQMALDFRLNPNTVEGKASLQRCIDLFDWAYDQGWADSSAMGILYLNAVRTTAWPHAFFLLRNYLPEKTYNNTLRALGWYTQIGYLYGDLKNSIEFKNADDIRGIGVAKLIYALTLKEPKLKVATLQATKKYFTNAFTPSPGLGEIFKNDFSTYHHAGPYTSEYGDDALHQACLIYYLFAQTSYQLDANVYNLLKGAVLRYDLFSANHRTPSGTSGRFPTASKNIYEFLPAYLYLGFSGNMVDTTLIATFKRLYYLDEKSLEDFWFRKTPAVSISLTKTLGASKWILHALKYKLKPNTDPSGTVFMPFSGLFVARQNGWLATVKGFSKYISDFECIGNEGRYARYLGYGNFQLSSSLYQKDSYTPSESWDWSHFPGTTAKALTMQQLDVSKNGPNKLSANWISGDHPFLGGTNLSNTTGMFAMQLHDATFDKSFEAKKTVVHFGNLIYFIGSGIRNNDDQNNTHTTLLQNIATQTTDEILLNNKAVTTDVNKVTAPVEIKDNWNNVYVVYPVDEAPLTVAKRIQEFPNASSSNNMAPANYLVAWIDHGKKPINGKYAYALLLQPDKAMVKKALSDGLVNIIRQDDTSHIVYNTAQNIYAYSMFNASSITNAGKLKKVHQPCIVMEQNNNGILQISFSDPDLRIELEHKGENVPAKPVNDTIDFKGNYQLVAPSGDVTASYLKNENITRVVINAVDGKTYQFQLQAIKD